MLAALALALAPALTLALGDQVVRLIRGTSESLSSPEPLHHHPLFVPPKYFTISVGIPPSLIPPAAAPLLAQPSSIGDSTVYSVTSPSPYPYSQSIGTGLLLPIHHPRHPLPPLCSFHSITPPSSLHVPIHHSHWLTLSSLLRQILHHLHSILTYHA